MSALQASTATFSRGASTVDPAGAQACRKRPAAAAAAAAGGRRRRLAARPSTSSSSSSSAAAPSAAAAAAPSGEHPRFDLSQCEAAEASCHRPGNPEVAPLVRGGGGGGRGAARRRLRRRRAMELLPRQRLHAAARNERSGRADLCAAPAAASAAGREASTSLCGRSTFPTWRRAMCSRLEIAACRGAAALRRAPRAARWRRAVRGRRGRADGDRRRAPTASRFDLLGVARPPWRRPEDILPPPPRRPRRAFPPPRSGRRTSTTP